MNPVGAGLVMVVGVSLAYAGREIARSAYENEIVWKAYVGLGLFVLAVVAIFLALDMMSGLA